MKFSYKTALEKTLISSSSSVQLSSESISTFKSIILVNIKCPQNKQVKGDSGEEANLHQVTETKKKTRGSFKAHISWEVNISLIFWVFALLNENIPELSELKTFWRFLLKNPSVRNSIIIFVWTVLFLKPCNNSFS